MRLPYRMWRAPALDFVVSAGMTYRASDGVRVDREASVYAAGEIARLSYDARADDQRQGRAQHIRGCALIGPTLTPACSGPFMQHISAVGDVDGFDSPLTGSPARGRGAVVTNRPLTAQAAFDRTRFEGDLPTGWEAEIYRNGELLGFAKPTAASAMSLTTFSFSTATTASASCFTAPRGRSGRARK